MPPPSSPQAATFTVRVLIAGAGPAGLAAAATLQQAGMPGSEIAVLDAGSQAGGLASGFRGAETWDWSVERYYHHLFTNDVDILKFTRELDLQDLVEIHSPVTAYWYRGRPLRLDSPASLLAVPGLSLPDKVRMGMVLAWLRWHPRPPWHRHDTVTAHAWLERWMGHRAYAALWQSLLEGKFGPWYREVSLAWFAARIYKRTSRLGYFKGGFQAWSDAVRERVAEGGTEVGFNTPLTRVEAQGATLTVRFGRQRWENVRAVLYTGPPGLLGRIAPALPETYRARLVGERHMGAVVLTAALDRSLLNGVYWLSIPASAGLPFLALVEHTAMVPKERYGGSHILYLGSYVEQDHPWLSLPEQEVAEAMLAGLPHIHPGFDPAWVRGRWLNRTAWAQPIPAPGSGGTRLPLRTPLPGLYLATMSQVWPWDRGTNYAVRIGRQAARRILVDLRA